MQYSNNGCCISAQSDVEVILLYNSFFIMYKNKPISAWLVKFFPLTYFYWVCKVRADLAICLNQSSLKLFSLSFP